MTDKQKHVKAVLKFRATNEIKRVELSLRPQEYARIKSAADAAGEPVSTYIKKAAMMRIGEEISEEENGQPNQ